MDMDIKVYIMKIDVLFLKQYNAKPLDTELEKIKAEMLTELYVNRVTKEALINIIDNHIKEPKGENE